MRGGGRNSSKANEMILSEKGRLFLERALRALFVSENWTKPKRKSAQSRGETREKTTFPQVLKNCWRVSDETDLERFVTKTVFWTSSGCCVGTFGMPHSRFPIS